MVFINDLLEENQRQRSESSHAATAYSSRFRFDLQAGCDHLRRHLIGQDQVCQTLCDALAVIKADIADSERPLWSALLAGPTGVGKTSSVKLMAEVLTGSADAYCRVDMNTLSQSHYAAAISGAPPGYVGSKEGVSLFDETLIKGDFSTPGIVLFDEIEKASDEVIWALLNVLEEGKLTLTGSGKTLDFRNSLIFFTTNLGSRSQDCKKGWRERLRLQKLTAENTVKAALDAFFAPEFFNRLDAVLVYEQLSLKSAEDIFSLALSALNHRLRKKSVTLTLSTEVVNEILRRGFDQRYGARAVRRVLRDCVETPLAKFLLTGSVSKPEHSAFISIHGELHAGAVVFSQRST
ncbi:AAA family ATPase [Gilvimarinus chinensis]|uniref:AAA family ATPase n=1 Tax=Gilvimarinus chinensis TaxID=396005 RepID=UPI000364D54F|nr:AAA family ATPase [Gilvimarinus chinensis]